MNQGVRTYYHFGAFRLDVAARTLLREGEIVPLTPKIFETLLLLLQHRGKLVERAQLIQKIWHDDFVEEGNISSTIYLLRKALGDNRHGQCFIATVSRQGYRFVAPVRELCVAEQPIVVPNADVIAVLPFRSLKANEGDEGLSLGLANALITQLSNCRKLTVRPTSVMRKYVHLEIDPVTVGQELGVTWVVECNFQRSGDYIRVTAQLISVRDNVPLWAATYDEQFTDLFTVEDILSKNISNDLIFELIDKSVAEKYWSEAEQIGLEPLHFTPKSDHFLQSYKREF
jgi:DNA-binding winged helix-turn-helix (wHTH) protein